MRIANIRMVALCNHLDLRRLEGVVHGESELEIKLAAGIWCVGWPFDDRFPYEKI